MSKERLLLASGIILILAGCAHTGVKWDGSVTASGTTNIEFMVSYSGTGGVVSDPPVLFDVELSDDGVAAATALEAAYPLAGGSCTATRSGNTVRFSCPGRIEEMQYREGGSMSPWTTATGASATLPCGLEVGSVP